MYYEAIDLWSTGYISHHGVKGMKWGVRKDRAINRVKKAANYVKNTKQRRYERSDYAKAKTLSDQEMRNTINRINLEQSYISAVQRDRAARKEATQSILVRKGKKTLRSIFGMGVGVAESSARNAMTNKINDKFPITKKPKKR